MPSKQYKTVQMIQSSNTRKENSLSKKMRKVKPSSVLPRLYQAHTHTCTFSTTFTCNLYCCHRCIAQALSIYTLCATPAYSYGSPGAQDFLATAFIFLLSTTTGSPAGRSKYINVVRKRGGTASAYIHNNCTAC